LEVKKVMTVKEGILRKDTFIHFSGYPTLVAHKGARVKVERGELKVEGVPFTFVKLALPTPCPYRKNCGERGCQGVKRVPIFFARGEDGEPPLRVEFPDGGPTPFPFSLL
jgi:hypothetical protein